MEKPEKDISIEELAFFPKDLYLCANGNKQSCITCSDENNLRGPRMLTEMPWHIQKKRFHLI